MLDRTKEPAVPDIAQDTRALPVPSAAPAPLAQSKPARKRSLRLALMLGGVAVVALGSGYFWLTGGRYVSTDDAYVRAAKLMVSTDVSGIVSDVDVKEGQSVKAGDVLFRIDPRQYQIALDNAKASLAETALNLEAAKVDYQRMLSDIASQQAAGWTPDVPRFELITNSMVQGAGLGFVFTPLTVVAFATLPTELRTDGTALFSLVRNVGSAIGVSVTSFLLAQNTQIMHAALAEHVNPFNRMLQSGGAYQFWNIANPQSLAVLNAEITRQSTIIAYVDDFKLMMLVTLPTALLLLLMRSPKAQPGAETHAEVLD